MKAKAKGKKAPGHSGRGSHKRHAKGRRTVAPPPGSSGYAELDAPQTPSDNESV